MIYTVTFNPAIDYVVHADDMQVGAVNRSRQEEVYFGGKGINVSVVLHELGLASKALGFVAGFTGEAIEQGLRADGIETDFIHLEKGFSRINVKIKSGEETELNGQARKFRKTSSGSCLTSWSRCRTAIRSFWRAAFRLLCRRTFTSRFCGISPVSRCVPWWMRPGIFWSMS